MIKSVIYNWYKLYVRCYLMIHNLRINNLDFSLNVAYDNYERGHGAVTDHYN